MKLSYLSELPTLVGLHCEDKEIIFYFKFLFIFFQIVSDSSSYPIFVIAPADRPNQALSLILEAVCVTTTSRQYSFLQLEYKRCY